MANHQLFMEACSAFNNHRYTKATFAISTSQLTIGTLDTLLRTVKLVNILQALQYFLIIMSHVLLL